MYTPHLSSVKLTRQRASSMASHVCTGSSFTALDVDTEYLMWIGSREKTRVVEKKVRRSHEYYLVQ